MSASRDKSQAFKFDYKNNFYLLYKREQWDTEAPKPSVVSAKSASIEDLKQNLTKLQQFSEQLTDLFNATKK